MLQNIDKTLLPSILDNDFYKFTMQCAVVKLFPDVKAKYQFINRGKHIFPKGFGDALRQSVDAMAQLKLTKDEKQYLIETCPYLNPAYIDFLAGYRYDPSEVTIHQDGHYLEVYVSGYWYRTILWEVPLLALISELFYKYTYQERWPHDKVVDNTNQKTQLFNKLGVRYAEFGTRRRHSYKVHREVVEVLSKCNKKGFIGSSNVHMAMLYGVKPIGTHAHEWFMFHAARYGFKMSNAMGLENWVEVYRGDLGVALSDTYTTEIFFKQFDKKFAKLFDGVRHDSGDPIEFANKTIEHYENHGINPLYKFIIFSDALNPEKIKSITEATQDKIGISFGIGTNLTNDVGLDPMNIVIKLTDIMYDNSEWIPTVKLSDEPNKHTGNPNMILLAKELLNIY